MLFSKEDEQKVIKRYSERFAQFGYSQKSVGWGEKGKQDIRFEILTSVWDLNQKTILDIGAGFGDLYQFAKNKYKLKSYTGIELVSDLIKKGNEIYGNNPDFKLLEMNFLDFNFEEKYDYAFVSGMFNFKLLQGNNYEFIESVISKVMGIVKHGFACNFITDRVDYQEELIFNAKPEKILEIGYKFTKNLALRSDYFPFEYTLYLNKDDSFLTEDTIFNEYKQSR